MSKTAARSAAIFEIFAKKPERGVKTPPSTARVKVDRVAPGGRLTRFE